MGDLVGRFTGHFVGFAGGAPHVGMDEGARVGSDVEGTGVGIADGAGVGMDEGAGVGADVEGAGVGIADGARVGVGYTGQTQEMLSYETDPSKHTSQILWPISGATVLAGQGRHSRDTASPLL